MILSYWHDGDGWRLLRRIKNLLETGEVLCHDEYRGVFLMVPRDQLVQVIPRSVWETPNP